LFKTNGDCIVITATPACPLVVMVSQSVDNSQQVPNAGQINELMLKLGANVPALTPSYPESSHFRIGPSRLTEDVPQQQPQTHTESKPAHKRRASLTSQSSLDTLKIQSEMPPTRVSGQSEDKLSLVGTRPPTGTRPGKVASLSVVPSQPSESLSDTPINSLANLESPEQLHASPLDALLSPTTPLSQTRSPTRDSVAGSDFGEVRLDDDERFSTVSLSAAATAARDSTMAIKSPVDEKASKPWGEEEPAPAPSEISGAVRTSFLLQRLENEGAPGSRRSLDGQQKLQEVFERAQRDSKDLEGDFINVDWGEFFLALFVQTALFTHVQLSGVPSCRVRAVQRATYFPSFLLTRSTCT
jgi:hypothetical protein